MKHVLLMASVVLAASLAGSAWSGEGWQSLRVPGYWEKRLGGSIGEHDGFAWYRCFVKVPESWKGLPLRLDLGKIDDCDETFFNGAKLGSSGSLPPRFRTASGALRRYAVPPQAVRAGGDNLLAVRVYDGAGGGGIWQGPCRLWCEKGLLHLEGTWQFRTDDSPAWASWPGDPAGPEARKQAEEFRSGSASPVGRLEELTVAPQKELAGTKPLTMEGDLAAAMVAGLRALMLKRIEASVVSRETLWRRDFSSPEAYVRSVEPNRQRLRHCIGAVDPRQPATGIELVCTPDGPVKLGETEPYTTCLARWPALDGVDAEGLLLQPKGEPVARVVALPDADWTPEMLAGVAPGVPLEAQFARRLAASGCQVLVPLLVDRKAKWSGNPRIRMTDQSHREWVYRMAYEMGRHLIGYEVQKVLAAVDQFARLGGPAKIGVIGYGEGGLLALYAAALDPRIHATVVSGYFQRREEVWKEPIYRNVWGLLAEFGDAGVASLIAPRPLIIEPSRGPVVGKQGSTPGELVSPPLESVKAEFEKLLEIKRSLKNEWFVLLGAEDAAGLPGRPDTLGNFLHALTGRTSGLADPPSRPLTETLVLGHDRETRAKRQLDQLVRFTQNLMRQSEYRRAELWAKADHSSLEAYRKSIEPYREMFRKELIGEVPPPSAPPNPRSRLAYVEPKWTGYEVVLDVWPGVFAYGILLVPNGLRAGERRPVVVCQHGLEGRPQDVADPAADNCYHAFAAKLAERGFVVFAPQNPYIGGDGFRVLQRMANPLRCTLFSMIIRQHEVITDWLASLPFVDPARIGFYGLSYGGKSAMRIPALVARYCLSICSADFNEWVVKNVTIAAPYSYMFTGEYDMAEFNLGHLANYAEMAALIAPRPFMVERGHRDGVAPDEWVAYEYAKVRRRYADLRIPDRTEIEFFDGPHEIHGVGTFRFLHRHLGWPEPAPR